MNTQQLRAIIERYGNSGLLFVAGYMGCRHLWAKHRSIVCAVIIGFFLTLVACIKSMHSPAISVPKTVVRVAPPQNAPKPSAKLKPDYRPTKRLLDIAKPILHLPNDYTTHFWLSDTKLLLITGKSQQQEEAQSLFPSDRQGKVELIDTRSGKRTLMRGLPRVMNQCEGEPYNFEWSPRHRWLKWMCYRTPDQWPFPVVARLDGTGFQELGQDKFSDTFWLDDNHWVEIDHRANELVVNNISRRSVRRFSMNSRQAQKILHRHQKREAEAEDVTYSEQFPTGASMMRRTVAARTKKIAYLVGSAHEEQNYCPTFAAFWVSSRDGNHLRELGYLPLPYTEENYRDAMDEESRIEESLEWLPGGKHLAFVYRDVLYTVNTVPPAAYRPRKRLTDFAKPLMRVGNNHTAHFWMSPTKILLISGKSTKWEPDSWRGQAESIDTRTSKRTHLAGLTRLLNNLEGTPGGFEWSPGRRWLKWTRYQTGDGWPGPIVAHLDGNKGQALGQDKFSQTQWLDRRHWAEVEARDGEPNRLIIHDVEKETKASYPLTSRQARRLLRHHVPQPRYAWAHTDRGIGIYLRRWGKEDINIANTDRNFQYFITLPEEKKAVTDWTRAEINPQSNRVLYRVKFYPRNANGKSYFAIWTSHINGRHLHYLGAVAEEDWHGFEWMPDGKHISFVCGDMLSTIAVP